MDTREKKTRVNVCLFLATQCPPHTRERSTRPELTYKGCPEKPKKPIQKKTTEYHTACILSKRPALYNLGCSPILIPSSPTIASCNLCSLSKITPRAPPSSLASNSANCAGTGRAADGGPSDDVESVPRRDGVLWVMNSV
jgi:hypothetical protein